MKSFKKGINLWFEVFFKTTNKRHVLQAVDELVKFHRSFSQSFEVVEHYYYSLICQFPNKDFPQL
jgi:hypothetical protein